MDDRELERCARRAMRLGNFWRSRSATFRKVADFQASTGTDVSDVQFLPGHDGNRLVTVSKGIWSVITCWDITSPESACSPKVAEWSPKGAIFTGFVVNSDRNSKGMIATSVTADGRKNIQILSIVTSSFQTICSIDSPLRPIALQGDLIAFSDDSTKTTIMNWKSGAAALLCSSEEPIDHNFQYNRCLRVVFAHKSVLVVRARSIELFAEPTLHPDKPSLPSHPIGCHSFGWIDGVSVGPGLPDPHGDSSSIEALSILLRAESDDPWSSEMRRDLDLFSIQPNPLYIDDTPSSGAAASGATPPAGCQALPYLFPPVPLTVRAPSVRGVLRCTDIILGRFGTAVWIQPRWSRDAGLTSFDVHASETQAPEGERISEVLAATVLGGPLQRQHPDAQLDVPMLWANKGGGNWTAIDYDEERGRIATGSTRGRVTVLEFG